MAAEERSISDAITTDAAFRTWGSTVSDLMQDNALTKTSDIGQIDWTTVVRPAASASFNLAGYEIFRLTTDTHHSSYPLFLRIDYGVSSTAQDRPAMRIQVGSSTNGAGTLGGVVGNPLTLTSQGGSATKPHYCSGGDGRFIFVGGWEDGATWSGTGDYDLKNTVFIIERLRDNTGAPTANGIYTLFTGINPSPSGGFAQILRSDDWQTPPTYTRLGASVPSTTGNKISDLYLFTHHPVDYALYNPNLSNLFYYYGDIATGSTFQVSMYGTNRTYKAIGRNEVYTGAWSSFLGTSNVGLAILWE